jgi:hypothetical protein
VEPDRKRATIAKEAEESKVSGFARRSPEDRDPHAFYHATAMSIDTHRIPEARRITAAAIPRPRATHSRWIRRRTTARGGGGRPRIGKEVRDLIRRMSIENPLWGAPKIHGELLKLGIDVAQSTVSIYMVPRQGRPCRPGRFSFAIMWRRLH